MLLFHSALSVCDCHVPVFQPCILFGGDRAEPLKLPPKPWYQKWAVAAFSLNGNGQLMACSCIFVHVSYLEWASSVKLLTCFK